MASETQVVRNDGVGRDWRVWFGISATLFWLWLGVLYIHSNVGWGELVSQPADALGSFLEGAFAPLAFLWLVLGFFLQQRELRHNNRAIGLQYEQMRRTAENAEIQSRAISANELHQRQETLLLVADRVHGPLGRGWRSTASSSAPRSGRGTRTRSCGCSAGSSNRRAAATPTASLPTRCSAAATVSCTSSSRNRRRPARRKASTRRRGGREALPKRRGLAT